MNKTSNPNVYKPKSVSTPRNAFDLSYHSYFTKPLGLLTPVFCMDVTPNDYIKLSPSAFTRTQTLNTAAYTRLRETVDFYFVPYRLLWSWWTDFISGVPNTNSNYNPNGNTVPTDLPWCSGAQIATLLNRFSMDIYGFPAKYTVWRILDFCGFPTCETLGETRKLYDTTLNANAPYAAKHFSVLRLYAFARLYHDFYRNTDWEANNAAKYNLDQKASNAQVTDAELATWMDSLKYAYKNAPKNMFTSCKPSALYATSVQPKVISTDNFRTPLQSVGNMTSMYTTLPAAGSQLAISAQSVRAVLAMEKMAQISMLAPKNYAAQMKAHFGVDVDSCQYCNTQFIGSYDSRIEIGEVTATASGDNGGAQSTLGQIAGKGIGSGSGFMKFHAKEHGIIMGIHYIMPDTDYNADNLDLFITKFKKEDFFMPEYDALGMQPCLAAEFTGAKKLTNANVDTVIGYHSRYSEYKSAVNRVHGSFQEGGSLSHWCAPFPLADNQFGISLTEANYKVSPSTINSICAVTYNGDDSTDQFLCHYNFGVTAVRDMSVFGIPNL